MSWNLAFWVGVPLVVLVVVGWLGLKALNRRSLDNDETDRQTVGLIDLDR